jgi:hypothetical protein
MKQNGANLEVLYRLLFMLKQGAVIKSSIEIKA